MCYCISSCSWITLKRWVHASLNWTHCSLGPSVSRNIDTFLISLTCIQRWQGIAPCQGTGCFNPMERLQIPRNSQTAAFPSWAQGSWVHICGRYLQNWTLSAALNLLPVGLRLRALSIPRGSGMCGEGLGPLVFPRHLLEEIQGGRKEWKQKLSVTQHTHLHLYPSNVHLGALWLTDHLDPYFFLPFPKRGAIWPSPMGVVSQTVTVTDNKHKPSISSCQQLSNAQKGICVAIIYGGTLSSLIYLLQPLFYCPMFTFVISNLPEVTNRTPLLFFCFPPIIKRTRQFLTIWKIWKQVIKTLFWTPQLRDTRYLCCVVFPS